jgi:HEPN domain-containing protein
MVSSKSKSMTRKDLQELARLRLREAEALYDADFYDGSVYLAGYAVELALKAKICRLLHLAEYPHAGNIGPSFKVHNLEQLKVLAGLTAEIAINKNKDLFDNWSKAVDWDPEQRYEPSGRYDAKTAKVILDSIRAKPDGVLTWLTKRW